MASSHRVYLKNLNFSVTKSELARALNGAGLPQVTLDDVNVVRVGKSNPNSMCSAFVTLQSAENVELSVQLLHGRVLPGCSKLALHAEKAIPRISPRTFVSGSQSSGSTVGGGAGSSDSGPSAIDAAVAHWIEVKKEEKKEGKRTYHSPTSPSPVRPCSAVDAAVAHWVGMKKEGKERKRKHDSPTSPAETVHRCDGDEKDETPWGRRVRKRTT